MRERVKTTIIFFSKWMFTATFSKQKHLICETHRQNKDTTLIVPPELEVFEWKESIILYFM